MERTGASGRGIVAVVGDRVAGLEPQAAIEPSIEHAAARLGVVAPVVRWVGTDELAEHGAPSLLADAHGVWCAPGSPYRDLHGALDGIRFAREQRVPFLGTCAGFQHAVIEVARNVAGIVEAHHEEYGFEGGDLIIHELLCSLVGQTLEVEVVDDELRSVYGADRAEERYYCRFGLNPDYVPSLEDVGLVVAAIDAADGQPRVMRFVGHPFFVLTLFVPQTASTPTNPHPIVEGFVAATVAAAAHDRRAVRAGTIEQSTLSL